MASDYVLRSSLSRDQLAKVFKTPELIRAFEALTTDVAVSIPANEAEISRVANMALALAAQALMYVSDLAPEDAPAIPGPRGEAGAQGLPGPPAALFSEDGAVEAWPPLMHPTIDPTLYFYHGPNGLNNPAGRGPYYGLGFSGRPTIFLDAITNSTDLVLRAKAGEGQIRFSDTAGVELFSIDAISSRVNCHVPVVMKVYTVATLPAPSLSIPPGSRAMVSDALAPAFGAVVAGGGGVTTPVYVDGAGAWRVG